MCARYTIIASVSDLQTAFELFDLPEELAPNYNVSPSTWVPTVVREAGHGRELRLMRWGLVPPWANDLSRGPVNARSEEAAGKPFFRAAMRRRRCLVPASGYFEWREEDGRKQPYYFTPANDRLFALGGLWERREDIDGVLETFAVLTTSPNEKAAEIHDRMPVIVPSDAFEEWLDPAQEKTDRIAPLMAPYPADRMRVYKVTPRMNNPRFNSPEAVARLDD